MPYYESYIDPMAPFSTKFPRARNYHSIQSIAEAFPHLQTLNDANFDIESISSNAQFYILRSVNDDNIHKVLFIFLLSYFSKNRLLNIIYGQLQ